MLAIAAALALVAAQGQALELAYSDEAGLASVEANWEGHRFRLVKHDARWIAVVGVDLDAKAGAHSAEVTFRYGDGRSRSVPEPVTVKAQKTGREYLSAAMVTVAGGEIRKVQFTLNIP